MIEIEADPTELQAANVVARNSEILSISLKRSAFRAHDLPGPLPEHERDFDFRLGWKTEPHKSPEPGRLVARAGLMVQLRTHKAKKGRSTEATTVATMEFRYELRYGIPSAPVPKAIVGAKGIEAFCKWNALYNCWPFFREDVRRTCAQAGLPSLTLPLLKLSPRQKSTPAAK